MPLSRLTFLFLGIFCLTAMIGCVLDTVVLGSIAPALFSSGDGATHRLGEGSAVLGVLPSPRFLGHKHEVHSDDLLVIFTDGLTEIENSKCREFVWNRLQAVVERHKNLPLMSISDAIFEEGIRWAQQPMTVPCS